ncbi:MAG: VOC family protein [Actinomycetota bacterium]|nr:VOC family protein [Actinomycetota bacterium]
MSAFRILGVDHVTVTTPDELEADVVRWYEEGLRLEQIAKPEGTRLRGAWFHAGPQQIHISIDEHNPDRTAHFGLVVDDFGAIVERLRELGCHIEQAPMIPGRKRCFSHDPAGNRVEIVAFDEPDAGVH